MNRRFSDHEGNHSLDLESQIRGVAHRAVNEGTHFRFRENDTQELVLSVRNRLRDVANVAETFMMDAGVDAGFQAVLQGTDASDITYPDQDSDRIPNSVDVCPADDVMDVCRGLKDPNE